MAISVHRLLHRHFCFGPHTWTDIRLEPQFDPENPETTTAKRVCKRCRHCAWKVTTLEPPDHIEPGASYKWPSSLVARPTEGGADVGGETFG